MSTTEHTSFVYSASSASSSALSLANSSTKPQGEIPFVRRRLLQEQTAILSAIFDTQTHPSKEERTALAKQLGLEFKTVSAWFQNRRRTLKKKSLTWSRHAQENRYPSSKKRLSRRESVISLDCIASSRERPTNSVEASPRPALTTRKINTPHSTISPRKIVKNLWDHIPSSPPAAPSSPGVESVRLAALPRRSKALRSLEWACAKARIERNIEESVGEDWDVPTLVLDDEASVASTCVGIGEETETEEYEAITPDVSAVQLTALQPSPGVLMVNKEGVSPSDDMEAAMALLRFMGRTS